MLARFHGSYLTVGCHEGLSMLLEQVRHIGHAQRRGWSFVAIVKNLLHVYSPRRDKLHLNLIRNLGEPPKRARGCRIQRGEALSTASKSWVVVEGAQIGHLLLHRRDKS